MPRDYYIILGISREANLSKIKKAYRKIAKQFHPDMTSGDGTSDHFYEITDAYETLSNSYKRKEYDMMLAKQEARIQMPRHSEPNSKRKSPVETLHLHSSFVDEFFEGFVPGFLFGKSNRNPKKDLYIEMILSPGEAREGGIFPMTVPVFEVCHSCKKFDFRENLNCPVCFGSGMVKSEREFSLCMPPNISDGTRIRISLEDIGLKGIYLNLFITIDPSYASQYY